MRTRPSWKLLAGCLVPAGLLLGGCSLEHNQEPWANPGQQEMLGDELSRDAELAETLRDRLADGQRDR